MNALVNIQTQLEAAEDRVRRLEESLCEYPGNPSIVANLDSAVRVREKLRKQLEAVSTERNGD